MALSDCNADVALTQNQEAKLPIFKQTRWYDCWSGSDIIYPFAFLSQDLIFKWDLQRLWRSSSAARLLQSALTLNFPNLPPIPQELVT